MARAASASAATHMARISRSPSSLAATLITVHGDANGMWLCTEPQGPNSIKPGTDIREMVKDKKNNEEGRVGAEGMERGKYTYLIKTGNDVKV